MVLRADSPTAAEAPPAFLEPLRVDIFRATWIASLISNFGGMFQSVGAQWLMTSLAPSPDMIALVTTAGTAPLVLAAPLAGALADIVDRRIVMLVGIAVCMAASALLAAVTHFGIVSPLWILACTFLVASGAALTAPAWQASVVDQVSTRLMPQAVALNSLGFNIARSVGPAIGALILKAFGAAATFGINALTYVGMFIVLSRWRRPAAAAVLPPEPLFRAIGAGMRYVAASPALVASVVRGGAFGFCASATMALNPSLAVALGGAEITFGLLLGGFGAGALLGAVLSPRVRNALGADGLVTTASLFSGVAAIVAGMSPWLVLTLLALFVAGAAWVMVLSSLNVSVQSSAPRWVAGRAISLSQMSTFAGMAIGAALWGVIAARWSVGVSLAASGVVLMASAALRQWFPLGEEADDLRPFRAAPLDDPDSVLDHRSGPIVVHVEYRVAPSDVQAFADVMAAIRRIRQRDGARGWRLLQDLDDRTHWVERFHVPTWLDYLRLQVRVTYADVTIREDARRFQVTEPRPSRRLIERPGGATPLGAERPPHPPAPDV